MIQQPPAAAVLAIMQASASISGDFASLFASRDESSALGRKELPAAPVALDHSPPALIILAR
jgi:hypothetical protein